MKKTLSFGSKMLAILLTMTMIIGILPMTVFAEEVGEALARQEYIDNLLENPAQPEEEEKAEVLYEVKEKRDEYSKVFKRSDGTYTAVVSSTPLHYDNDGVWEDVDNTLVSDGSILTNNSGIFSAELPKTISENDGVSVKNGSCEVSFTMNDIGESNAAVQNNIGEVSSGGRVIKEAVEQTASGVIYEDVVDGTDLQYIVTSQGLKENIIVDSLANVRTSYTFTIAKGNLTVLKDGNGNILFKDNQDNVKFTIPAPVMTDAGSSASYDIAVNIANSDASTVAIEYIPSQEWLGSADRTYPVIIDPAILVGGDDTLIQDTVIINETADQSKRETNYALSALGFALDQAGIYADTLVNFEPSLISSFAKENIVLTEAQFCLEGYAFGGNICIKPIEGNWDYDEITYDDVFPGQGTPTITYDNDIIDYYTGKPTQDSTTTEEYVHFNITRLVDEWLTGSRVNNGFVITAYDTNVSSAMLTRGCITVNGQPYNMGGGILLIDYVDTSGYNSNLSYHTQNIGRAGTVYVNDFSRGMSVIRNDLSIGGNIMPATIGFTYRSSYDTFFREYEDLINAYEPESISLPNYYGGNWYPSYVQILISLEYGCYMFLTETGSIVTYYQTEEDGNIVFIEDSADTLVNSGYTLELIDPEEDLEFANLRIITPEGFIETFNENGMVVQIIDQDYSTQCISIVYDENSEFSQIDYVTDGVGRKYDFTYDSNNLLTSVNCMNADDEQIMAGSSLTEPLRVTYVYTDGNLTGVIYPDGESVTYDYDANGNMTEARDVNNYAMVYTYDILGKVTNIKEYAERTVVNSGILGNTLGIEPLGTASNRFTDGTGAVETYQFDKSGQLLYMLDGKGNYYKSSTSENSDSLIISSNSNKTFSQDLLKNSSFEGGFSAGWNNNFDRIVSVDAHTGKYLCDAERTSNGTQWQQQTVDVSGAGYYTLSAHVKSVTSGTIKLKIQALDESNTVIGTETVSITETDGWQRFTVILDTSSPVKKIRVYFGFEGSQGHYYIDDVQLEKGSGASSYNYIENGSFNYTIANNWVGSTATVVDETINGEAVKALSLTGGLPFYYDAGNNYEDDDNDGEPDLQNTEAYVMQENVAINGKKGDVFSLGGWFKGNFVRNSTDMALMNSYFNEGEVLFSDNRYAQLEIHYTYTDGATTGEDTIAVPFDDCISGWQFASQVFALKGDCETVDVVLRYENHPQTSLFGNIELIQSDEIIAPSLADLPEAAGISEDDIESLKSEVEAREQEAETTETETKDSFGNLLTNSVYDGNLYQQSTYAYTSDGNYLLTATDTNHLTTGYSYNIDNGMPDSMTDGEDNVASYTYNGVGYLTAVTAAVSGLTDSSAAMTVSLAYDGDQNTGIITGNTSGASVEYEYGYNSWGQVSEITVDEILLVSYTYGTGVYRSRVNQIAYGNGTVIEYLYDLEGNINEANVYENEELVNTYLYTYNSFGTLCSVLDENTQYLATYNEDGTVTVTQEGQNVYSAAYDSLDRFVETVGSGTSAKTYTMESYDSTYSEETGFNTSKEAISGSGKTIGTSTVSDRFDRIIQSTVMTKDPTDTEATDFASITTGYTYGTYDTDKTTGLIAELTNTIAYGGNSTELNFAYDYDGNGNITAEYAVYGNTSALRYQYIYDEAGQLVRVNDAVRQKTFTYAYDSRGNITERKTYIYTTAATLSNPIATDTYGYAPSAWEDRLTNYNSTTANIQYDEIGNPTTYRSASLTWSGRQLTSYTKNGKIISFNYDANGMRYSKTVKVNDVETETYNYIYSDTKLIAVTFTKNNEINTARFIYDSNDELRGFILNDNQTYLYVKNLQGDIISIVDENGTILLNYSYDSWGDVDYIIPSGSNLLLAAMLATLNPFTYRSYCYDYDIGLYYLQSRYYDPETCRFINADSTDYLGVSGTLLGYNLFAYCENEPVGKIDATGTWAYDVHCGYYTDNNRAIYLYDFEDGKLKRFYSINTKVKNRDKQINVRNFTDTELGKVYIPYRWHDRSKCSYGTYYWAKESGFPCYEASVIADCCNGIDKLFTPITIDKSKQSWHFNTNWNTDDNVKETNTLNDTRLIYFLIMLIVAADCFETAKTTTDISVQAGSTKRGLQFLGYSLHPLQDFYAHTRDRCHYGSYYIPINQYGQTGNINFWYHCKKDDEKKDITDSASIRYSELSKTQTATCDLLKVIYSAYKGLFLNCAP